MRCWSCAGRRTIDGRPCPDCSGGVEEPVVKVVKEELHETPEAKEWSADEEAQLVFLIDDGSFSSEEIAEYFGRTIEACRQRRYELLWRDREGRNKLRERYKHEHRKQEPEYVPIPVGPDEDQWWSPTYYLNRGREIGHES